MKVPFRGHVIRNITTDWFTNIDLLTQRTLIKRLHESLVCYTILFFRMSSLYVFQFKGSLKPGNEIRDLQGLLFGTSRRKIIDSTQGQMIILKYFC